MRIVKIDNREAVIGNIWELALIKKKPRVELVKENVVKWLTYAEHGIVESVQGASNYIVWVVSL